MPAASKVPALVVLKPLRQPGLMDLNAYKAAQIAFPIRRSLGSSEDALLHCTFAAAELFRFDQLDSNHGSAPLVTPSPWLKAPRRKRTVPDQRYRIALRDDAWSSKPRSVRIRLSKRATQGTLHVLCLHLDAVGAPWLWLCNEHGNRLPYPSFSSRHIASAA